MNTVKVLLAAGAVSLMGGASFAATSTWDVSGSTNVCGTGDILMGDMAIDCRGIYGGAGDNGNDALIDLNGDMFERTFGEGDYETGLFTKPTDDYSDYGSWSDLLGKVEGSPYYDVDGTTATVSLGDLTGLLNSYDQITMAFKQGPQIGFYLFDTPLDGGEDAFKYSLLNFSQSTSLSHLSFYGRTCLDDSSDDCGDDGTVVPLPAAGWLLLGGLGGLAALRRRKTA